MKVIAYPYTLLDELEIKNKIKRWFAYGLLDAETSAKIFQKYPAKYYNPNIFIKVGLFLFSLFVTMAGLSLISLMFAPIFSYANNFESLSAIISVVCLAACLVGAELLIQKSKLYKTGIVEALLYTAAGCVIAIPSFLLPSGMRDMDLFLGVSIICLPIFVFGAIRYLDLLLTLAAVFFLYSVVFILLTKAGSIAKLLMPFAILCVSAFFYSLSIKMRRKDKYFHYRRVIDMFTCCNLLVFYLAGNYYVVRESGVEFFNLSIHEGEDIPMAWFFYLFTAIFPLLLLYRALKLKNRFHLWCALFFVALSAFTFKYYFSLGHPEIAVTLAGIVVFSLGYAAIRYLKTDKNGITYKEDVNEDSFLKTHAEALTIAQSFIPQQSAQQNQNTSYGGGEFGGAGSGGKF